MRKLKILFMSVSFMVLYHTGTAQNPIAVFKPMTTESDNSFVRIGAAIENLQGKYKVTLVWRNHASVVRNVFLDDSSLSPIEEVSGTLYCQILSGENAIGISDAEPGTPVRIYNLMGYLLHSMKTSETFHEIPVSEGLYIVRVISGENHLSKKVIIF